MEATKRLYELQRLTHIIGNQLEEMELWKLKATQTTAQISGEGHGSGISDKVGNNVTRYIEIEDNIKDYYDRRQEILKELEELATEEYDILYFLYARPDSTGVDRIYQYADSKRRSYSWAFKLKHKAIEKYQEVLNERHKEQMV